MYEERYDSTSGCSPQPELERTILEKIFDNVDRNTNVKMQIQGCDYICDGKWVDCKIDYYDSSWDFCFETHGRGGHSWTDADHKTDYILYVKMADKIAFLIKFEELQRLKTTELFKKRKEFYCGDGAKCKFFRLKTELPVERAILFKGGSPITLKRAMSSYRKFSDEV